MRRARQLEKDARGTRSRARQLEKDARFPVSPAAESVARPDERERAAAFSLLRARHRGKDARVFEKPASLSLLRARLLEKDARLTVSRPAFFVRRPRLSRSRPRLRYTRAVPIPTKEHEPMKRSANAVWRGSLKEGGGTFSVASGAIRDLKYSFKTRFEGEPGANPEELIAAAHASCFSMAVGAQLGERGITPASIETSCDVTFENLALTKSVLTTKVSAPGADKAKIEEAAAAAKAGCPISKVLKLEIELHLTVAV